MLQHERRKMDYYLSDFGNFIGMDYVIGGDFKMTHIDMEYRKVFIKFLRENGALVYVMNDGNYLDSFWSSAETQEEFNKECEDYLNSERYAEKLKAQRGY